jgi:predicted nucleotide-binding protein
MENRHIDALRRIGQADEAWSRDGHEATIFNLVHSGGMQREIDHPCWDSSWAIPAEQTIDDLGELGFLRIKPHHDKRRSFDLTMAGREKSGRLREDGGESVVESGDDARAVVQKSSHVAEREIELFLGRAGSEVFSAGELADAVSNPKFDVRAAVLALRSLHADGRVRPHAGGWQASHDLAVSYHVRVVPAKATDQLSGALYAYDLTREAVIERFVAPYQGGQPIVHGDRALESYRKPKITFINGSGQESVARISRNLQEGGESEADALRMAEELFFEKASKDVTETYIDPSEPATVEAQSSTLQASAPANKGGSIFIVHGHSRKEEVDVFLRNVTGARPTILSDKAAKGRTIIEKFEQEADGSGFAVVLLTGDDLGRSKADPEEQLTPRARQNVVLELGYFIGKLGRDRVAALYDDGVELPSDYKGVEFISFANDWKTKLIRELNAAGLEIDPTGI